MSNHHALPAIEILDLISNGQTIQVVLGEFCNSLRFNAQLNQLEIAVEDWILQDEDIEVFPLSTGQVISLQTDSTQLHFLNKNDLANFHSWLKQHVDNFKIY